MTPSVHKHLLELNRKFYETTAPSFSRSRQTPWPGWLRVGTAFADARQPDSSWRLLDAGCGNGRFGRFLLEDKTFPNLHYVGIDENAQLLQEACRTLLPHCRLNLFHGSLDTFLHETEVPVYSKKFDAIVLFGVWHHLPGEAYRQQLLTKLADRLKPNGWLVISCWRFLRSQRLSGRLVEPSQIGLTPSDLEPGDYLLDWQDGEQAVRYCHDTEADELLVQADQADLRLTDHFSADGATNNLNDYYLFTRRQLLAQT